MIKGLLKVLSMLECAATGHVSFNVGNNHLPRFFQSKDVGNRYHDLKVCERCNLVYTVPGELTAEELAEEKRIEEINKAMHERMERATEELIKKAVEAKLGKEGKSALN